MKDSIVSFTVAKLAKEKGFPQDISSGWYNRIGSYLGQTPMKEDGTIVHYCFDNYQPNDSVKVSKEEYEECKSHKYSAPTQSLLQKFIRENRGVHIEIHRNASGYYWSMCKSDGGTDLGWSNISGPNDGGVWDSFEDALENALQLQLSYDLPENTKVIKHWGNYVDFIWKSK